MVKNKFKRTLWLTLFFIATPSISNASETNDDNYFYLDVGAGFAAITNLPNKALSLGVNAGYSFNDYFAVEALWNGQPSFQWNNYLLNNYNIYDLAVKGSLPLTDYFSMYGKLGYGLDYSSWSGTAENTAPSVYSQDNSALGSNLLATIGINFNISRELGIYLENNSYLPISKGNGSFAYSNATMLGLSYSFGRGSPVTTAVPIVESDPVYGVILSYQDSLNQHYNLSQESSSVPSQIIVQDNQLPSGTETQSSNIPLGCTKNCLTASQRLIYQADGSSYVVVLAGDTLMQYSRVFGVSVANLRKINHLTDKDKIVIGQKIYINTGNN